MYWSKLNLILEGVLWEIIWYEIFRAFLGRLDNASDEIASDEIASDDKSSDRTMQVMTLQVMTL